MARLIAIDYGLKRTGIAVTDPGQVIASPLTTIPTHRLIEYLAQYTGTNDVEGIVIGDPRNPGHKPAPVSDAVRSLAAQLEKKFPAVRIYLHDEMFTSVMALDAMIAAGAGKKDRRIKSNIDKVSAAIILQSFMERRSREKK
jgi:putative Holliday junction resolvase